MISRRNPAKACFMRRISLASKAIQAIDNEASNLMIYCLNCIRRDCMKRDVHNKPKLFRTQLHRKNAPQIIPLS